MMATNHGSPESLATRFDAVVMRLPRVALDLHLMRLPADALDQTRLDTAISGIDKTIRDCQIMAVGNVLTGEDGAGQRPGPHQA